MSRNVGPKCRLCRREGVKLFLKGARCYTDKCAVDRRQLPPGSSGFSRTRLSTYGKQLREKQKVKRIYGLNEAQMKKVFKDASSEGGDKGAVLLKFLEMRLDNVVYLLGLAPSRSAARQLVNHGHITVNGEKVTIASYRIDVGDKIDLKTKDVQPIGVGELKTPGWLKKKSRGGEVVSEPTRDMIDEGIKEYMIVEFYSR